MLVQWWKKSCVRLLSCGSIRTMHAHPCFNKCANQPRPDRTLMISRIPGARVALIVRRVSLFAGSERAQSDRRKQKHFHRIDNSTRFVFRQKHERQSADCKDLVRTKCEIDYTGLMIAIDYVSQVTGVFVPEFGFESGAALFEKCSPARGKFCTDGERVEP